MQDIQEGVIVELDGDCAKIRVSPHAGCNDCKACTIDGMTMLAANPLNAPLGAKVRFRPPQGALLTIAFLIFILPLLAVFSGIYAGSLLSSIIKCNKSILMIVFSVLLFTGSLALAYFYDKRYRRKSANLPEIVEVISQ